MNLKHLAIIPDGNRRYAKSKKLPAIQGHRIAVEDTFPKLFDEVQELGIKYCTVWLISPENFTKRSHLEISNILNLLDIFLKKKIKELDRKNINLKTIGDLSVIPKKLQESIKKASEKTKSNDKTFITFAINYGGRDEIIRAIKRLNKSLKGEEGITKGNFEKFLDTSSIPDPDLIIRTGGEKRTSGFLLWQSEYSEYAFTDTLFPEFSPKELRNIVKDFSDRKRRFGK